MKQQFQRMVCICEMIEGANSMITSLKKDLNNYNNPSPEFDKIRLMLDRGWIESKLTKYEAVCNRLQVWQQGMIQRLTNVRATQQVQEAA